MSTRRRKVVFACIVSSLSLALSISLIGLADLYVHYRTSRSAGFNIWGYRGPALGSKRAAEYRLAAVGGSTTRGYGVTWEDAYPVKLEADLKKTGAVVSVANLGFDNQGAHGFRLTLEDYLSLEYDAVIL